MFVNTLGGKEEGRQNASRKVTDATILYANKKGAE